MTRIFGGLAIACGLLVGAASPADAQFSVSVGNPYTGQGVTIGGAPAYGGYGYASPYGYSYSSGYAGYAAPAYYGTGYAPAYYGTGYAPAYYGTGYTRYAPGYYGRRPGAWSVNRYRGWSGWGRRGFRGRW